MWGGISDLFTGNRLWIMKNIVNKNTEITNGAITWADFQPTAVFPVVNEKISKTKLANNCFRKDKILL